MKTRCEINSIHAKAKAGALDGRRMWNTWLKKKGTNSFKVCSPAYGKTTETQWSPFSQTATLTKIEQKGSVYRGVVLSLGFTLQGG